MLLTQKYQIGTAGLCDRRFTAGEVQAILHVVSRSAHHRSLSSLSTLKCQGTPPTRPVQPSDSSLATTKYWPRPAELPVCSSAHWWLMLCIHNLALNVAEWRYIVCGWGVYENLLVTRILCGCVTLWARFIMIEYHTGVVMFHDFVLFIITGTNHVTSWICIITTTNENLVSQILSHKWEQNFGVRLETDSCPLNLDRINIHCNPI